VTVAAITAFRVFVTRADATGPRVLIDGASGGVGTFAVQIANRTELKLRLSAARGCGRARSIGADHVIDYTQEDFTPSGQRYRSDMAANAYHSLFEYRRALSQDGIYVWLEASQSSSHAAGTTPVLIWAQKDVVSFSRS